VRPRRSSHGLLLALVLGAGIARAASPLPLRLEWSAPRECPTGEQVERDLGRMTRVRPGRTLVPLEAQATITRQASGYHLVLELMRNGEPRQAQFDSQSCAPLRKAASLVLALAFGDGVELRSADEEVESTPQQVKPEPAGPSTLERDPGTPSAPRDLARSTWRVTPWAGASLSSGLVGSSSPGVDLGVGFGSRNFSGYARGGAVPPANIATREGVSVGLSALLFAAGACAGHAFPSLRVDGCLAFDAALVRARSSGAARDGSASFSTYAVTPAIAAWLPVTPPFALRLELAALVPLETSHYDVAPYGSLYSSARVAPRGSLGLAVEL
jgi:hypothetical protein